MEYNMNETDFALLQLESITKTFQAPENPITVLRNVDLTVEKGESVAIIGPSGSGKSTLLNIIGTLDTPTKGRVLLNGKDLTLLDETQLAFTRNRTIGFVFQLHHLLPHCTALENVLVPTLVTEHRADAVQRAQMLLEHVGLRDRQQSRPALLSGGERQRVAVVRALINEPILLLADEPTGALDHQSSMNLADLLCSLNRQYAITLIVVSHSLEVARRMDRVLELRDGTLHPRDDLK